MKTLPSKSVQLGAIAAILLLGIAKSTAAEFNPSPTAASARNPLVWDALEKTLVPSKGATNVIFSFSVTNTSSAADVVIVQLNPSCDCTTPSAKLPWKLAPGASSSMKAAVDIKGNSGNLVKTIAVVSTAGNQTLTMKINIPKDTAVSAKADAPIEKTEH